MECFSREIYVSVGWADVQIYRFRKMLCVMFGQDLLENLPGLF